MKGPSPKLLLLFGGMAGIGVFVLVGMAKSVGVLPSGTTSAEEEVEDLGDRVIRNDPYITYVPNEENPQDYQHYSAPVETVYSPSFGPEGAPIEIFEFGDFECPTCKDFALEMNQVFNQFPDQIHYVWKDFPIPRVHINAVDAAEAARCANDQGKYWEFHDRLFLNQFNLGEELYSQIGTETGLDMPIFESCRGGDTYLRFIEQDFLEGKTLGVNETPTIFINDVMFTGRMDADSISGYIQQVLNGEMSQI